MNNSSNNKYKKIEVRVSEEQFNRISELQKQSRYNNMSQYMRAKALEENKSVYDPRIERVVMMINSISEAAKDGLNEDQRKLLEREVAKLWQYLK